MANPLNLLGDSSDSEVEFSINKSYADRYSTWRNKEEMQKLKDLTKNMSDSSSESEEEDEPEIEEDFLKTLSLLKSKDPKIYDESTSFFNNEAVKKKPKIKKEKPMFMKDYERKLIVEKKGELSEDEEEHIYAKGPTMKEEHDAIKESFKAALEDSEEEGDSLFQVREKSKKEKDEEEADYIQWMKGQKEDVPKEARQEMSFLKKYWNDPKLDEGEKFLKDYILNQRFIVEDKNEEIPSYEEITMLSDDEKTIEKQEEFEHKYNFRFEEPDTEFIKRYPRTIGDSLRRTDTKRKQKREEHAERKKKEKEQKREELKRLKALKRKEIEDKFLKLKEISGQEEINFNEEDIESDFDPDKHDQKMKELFNDDYYRVEEEQKPEFEYDEELDESNWDKWSREQTSNKQKNDTPSESESDHLSDIENEAASSDLKVKHEKEMIEYTQTKKKREKKKSMFAKIIAEPKPVFDAEGKSFEEYLDEYYKLDFEDVVGDLPVRFKYRKVVPNDFGLSIDEILGAHDKELNRWCSVKKTCQYRRDEEEIYDVQAFKKKAENPNIKQKFLTSLYSQPKEDDTEPSTVEKVENEGGKKRRRKKKKTKSSLATAKTSELNGVGEMSGENPSVSILNSEENTKIDSFASHLERNESSALSASLTKIHSKGKGSKKNRRSNDSLDESLSRNSSSGKEDKSILDTTADSFCHNNSPEKKIKKSKSKKSTVTYVSQNDEPKSNLQLWNVVDIKESDSMYAVSSTNAGFTSTEENNLKKPEKRKKSDSLSLNDEICESLVKKQKIESGSSGHNLNTEDSIKKDICSLNSSELTKSSKKRKKKKKKFPEPTSDKTFKQQFFKDHLPQNNADKRLNLTNERLAAFGINAKKFKNRIIYGADSRK